MPDADASQRTLIVLARPAKIAGGLAVQMGKHVVLLPRPGDLTFYERVAAKKGQAVQLNGQVIPWPTRPEFLYDFLGTEHSGSP